MANIDISNVTNTTEVVNSVANGTGIFDNLMNTVSLYLDDQYIQGRLKGTDYANVLTGSIQAVLQQSMQFTLQEQLTEAQVDSILKDIDVKERQTTIAENQAVKDLLLKDADISLKGKQEGLIDSQIIGSEYDNQVKAEQVLMSTYERTSIQPKQLEKLEEEIDLLQSQDIELLANGLVDRDIKERSTVIQEDKLADELLTSDKQRQALDKEILLKEEQEKLTYTERVIKDKQCADLGLDNVYSKSKASKETNTEYVYTPFYEEI